MSRVPVELSLAEFEAERDRLALLTRKGIGMPLAGLLYWLAVAALLWSLPQPTALASSFVATAIVFPVGALITRLLGGNLFARSEILPPPGMLLAAVQLFYWPVVIVVFRTAPDWTPFVMAVLFGSHYLPYAWLYRSPGYGFLAVKSAVALSVAVVVTRAPC